MRLAVAQFRGSGVRGDPFVPDCTPAGEWGIFDLRGDSTSSNGVCLILGKDDTGPIPGALRDLGDVEDLDQPVPPAIRTWLENRLGVVFPTATTRRVMLRELLLDLGDLPGKWGKLRKRRDNFVRAIIADVELFSVPVIEGGSIHTEDFNKADSATLGPDLTWTEVMGQAEVYGNKWRNVSNNEEVYSRAEHDCGSANMYTQAKVDWTSSGNWILVARYSSSAQTFYMVAGNNEAPNGAGLYKQVAGAETQIGSTVNNSTNENTQYLFRIECDATTIRVLVNGVQIISQSDSEISTGQRGGVGAYAPATQIRWDDYEHGSLGSPTLVNVSTFATTTTFGTPNTWSGITLATMATVTTFSSRSVSGGSGGVFITLTPINIETTIFTPSVSTTLTPPVPVTISITLQPIDIEVSFGTPNIVGTQPVVPTHIAPADDILYTGIPPDIIKASSLDGITKVTTRLEVLNGNGTIFMTDFAIESGAVTVSVDRAERRTLDITLHDPDDRINHSSAGLWYDKILVPYRGITYRNHKWEAPLGRFYIDRISEPDFPNLVTITGRDQSKRLLLDKLTYATTFLAGEHPEDVIRVIATNGGITRMNLVTTGQTLGRDYTFERGTSRWEIIANLAEAFSLEVFFDSSGYLILREFRDPSSTASVWTFQTGSSVGNLASFMKSANDSRLFNHVVVVGESTAQLPVTAEAENNLPGSPVNIDRIGRRTYFYESNFVSTLSQAQDLADTLLRVMALESYEMEFEALVASWLEVGEVVNILDPRPWTDQPDRFLLTDLTIPIGLGAMSGTGKRVTLVGSTTPPVVPPVEPPPVVVPPPVPGAAPDADFTFAPSAPVVGTSVAFTDTSTQGVPTSWAWNFGDSFTSTLRNPTHTFYTAATFNVGLVATNAIGSDSRNRSIVVGAGGGGGVTPDFIVGTHGTLQQILDQSTATLANKRVLVPQGLWQDYNGLYVVNKDFGNVVVEFQSGAILRGSGNSGIEMYGEIKNITFVGPGIVEANANAIDANCFFIDADRIDKGANGNPCGNITVDGLTFQPIDNNGRVGRSGCSIWGGENFTIRNVTVRKSADNAAYGFGGAASGMSFGKSRTTGFGLPSHGYRLLIENCLIEDCMMEDGNESADRNGIILDLWHADFDNGSWPGIVRANRSVGHVMIRNNIVRNVSGSGIHSLMGGMANSVINIHNNRVEPAWGQHMDGPRGYGIGCAGFYCSGVMNVVGNTVVTSSSATEGNAYTFYWVRDGGVTGSGNVATGSGNNTVQFDDVNGANSPPAGFS